MILYMYISSFDFHCYSVKIQVLCCTHVTRQNKDSSHNEFLIQAPALSRRGRSPRYTNYYLFANLKLHVKGRRYNTDCDVMDAVDEFFGGAAPTGLREAWQCWRIVGKRALWLRETTSRNNSDVGIVRL